MKSYKGRRNIAPLFLDLGNRWKWVVKFHALAAISPGKTMLIVTFYVLIKGAFVGRIILYLSKCTVKQQLKFVIIFR